MEESLHFPQHLQNWSEVEVGVWEVPADSKALLRDADLCIPCTESGSDAGERGTRVSTPPILTCKPRAAQSGGWMDGWMRRAMRVSGGVVQSSHLFGRWCKL
jgi:hypothetical protein